MIATVATLTEPKARGRRFRFGRRTWPALAAPFVVAAVGLALCGVGLPLSWTADYDRARYAQTRRAIDADPQHLLGRRFDEVARTLGLEDVPWDDAAVQQPQGMYRIYHFRGFSLHLTLKLLPSGIAPDDTRPWSSSGEELQSRGVLWLASQYPALWIDGLGDRKERMARYWKAVDEECARINADMVRRRREQVPSTD